MYSNVYIFTYERERERERQMYVYIETSIYKCIWTHRTLETTHKMMPNAAANVSSRIEIYATHFSAELGLQNDSKSAAGVPRTRMIMLEIHVELLEHDHSFWKTFRTIFAQIIAFEI